MNNKTLAIAFGALLLIYLLTKLLGGNRDRSFDPNIVTIDTTTVDRIVIHPAFGGEFFEMQKTGNGWHLKRGADQYQATTTSVRGLLSNLSSIAADRIVSKNPDRYKDYAVDEDGGTRIEIFAGNRKQSDLVVGRFNFNQATRSGISYLRKYDDEAVYSVDGFLSMSLSQGPDNYRNKVLTSLNTSDLTRLTLLDNGSRITITKPDSIWRDPAGMEVDSAMMANYLNTIRSVNGGTFVNARSDVGERLKQLTIEGNNLPAPVEIHCYASRDTSHHFVVQASTNQEGYFFSDSSGIYKRFFEEFPVTGGN
jgi:hypothetical protein